MILGIYENIKGRVEGDLKNLFWDVEVGYGMGFF